MKVKYNFSSKLTQKFRKSPATNEHAVSFTKQVREVIAMSDIVLEILDARFIDKTRNASLEKEIRNQNKKLIFILNKADLVNVNELKFNYNLEEIKPYVLFSSKNKIGRSRLRELLSIESKRTKTKQVKVGVIGYPNTGKSSLINALCARKRAGTSPHAGHTKSISKIKFRDNIYILDSPGVLTGEEENSTNTATVTRQTEVGAKDYHKTKYPELIVNEIMKNNPELLDKFYKINSNSDSEVLLEKLGKKWNFLKKRGEIDVDRTARRILKDWQEGKIRG